MKKSLAVAGYDAIVYNAVKIFFVLQKLAILILVHQMCVPASDLVPR